MGKETLKKFVSENLLSMDMMIDVLESEPVKSYLAERGQKLNEELINELKQVILDAKIEEGILPPRELACY